MLLLKRLRKQLIGSNRLTSYLIYALGEILLVVVGILIAVSINNSNAQRRFELSEKLSLLSLIEDLKSDTSRFTFLNDRITERMELCDSTLGLINQQRTLEDRLAIISIHQINFFLVEANTTTYDEMVNTGRLYSLKDKELRADILYYYRSIKKWSNYIERDNQQLRTMMIQPIYNDYWVIQELIWGEQKVDTKKFPWLENHYSRELNDIEALIFRAEDTFGGSSSNIRFLKRTATDLLEKLQSIDD